MCPGKAPRSDTGTSAGAIVAALVAAGYSAKEIFDVEERSHILQRIAKGAWAKPTDLFTLAGWDAITRQIRTKKRLAEFVGWFSRRAKWQRRALAATALMVGAAAIWGNCPSRAISGGHRSQSAVQQESPVLQHLFETRIHQASDK
jgi:hypothetical protein